MILLVQTAAAAKSFSSFLRNITCSLWFGIYCPLIAAAGELLLARFVRQTTNDYSGRNSLWWAGICGAAAESPRRDRRQWGEV